MSFLERTTEVRALRHWEVDMSVDYIYTSGVAGERFFSALRDEGRLLAAKCTSCNESQLPPQMFCEACFSPLTEFVDAPLAGKVAAITTTHVDRLGNPLASPASFAFVTFQGVSRGGLVHRLLAPPDQIRPGMAVRVRLKPRAERAGTILDIEGFEAA